MMGNRPVRAAAAAIVAVLCLTAAACEGAPTPEQPSPVESAQGSAESIASDAVLSITPREGRMRAEPAAGISVTVSGGTITSVTAMASGDPVEGRLRAGGTAWHSTWALETNTRYTVRATAADDAGRRVTERSTFRTLEPSRTFSTTIFEGYRKTYGVGMPIILTFSSPIRNKRAVERSLEIRTSRHVVGAWYWDGDRTLYFRPRTYWRPHTTVRFVGHLDGVEGSPDVYGVHTLTQRFVIGRSLIAVADTRAHHVKIYRDKHLFATWPMSAGKPGDDTPNGTYLTMAKTNPEEMIGPGYDIEVPWSVRFTASGNFLHDAYWSVGDQGFANVSHGCVNLSPENARIYYGLAVLGDPVTITGSPRAGTWGDGWTVWFLSWSELLEGSATHQAVSAGPRRSSFVERAALHPPHATAPLGTSRPGNADATPS
jgi:lipoprotein-anchoring transpeptidase ErfK/SrfK